MQHSTCALLAGLLLFAQAVRAQEVQWGRSDPGELVTDRPDFTESAEVVAPGYAQLEMGFTGVRTTDHGVRWDTTALPLPLLRVGVARRFELRAGGIGLLWQSVRSSATRQRTSGTANFVVGMKVKLLEEGRIAPAVALIPSVSLPTGDDEHFSSGYDPTIGIAWAKALPKGFGSGGNVNFSSITDGTGRFNRRAYSLSIGHSLGVGGLNGYWEVYRISPVERGRGGVSIFGTGVTRGLGRNAQVDFYVERSLAGPFPSWSIGAGFAIRGPLPNPHGR